MNRDIMRRAPALGQREKSGLNIDLNSMPIMNDVQRRWAEIECDRCARRLKAICKINWRLHPPTPHLKGFW